MEKRKMVEKIIEELRKFLSELPDVPGFYWSPEDVAKIVLTEYQKIKTILSDKLFAVRHYDELLQLYATLNKHCEILVEDINDMYFELWKLRQEGEMIPFREKILDITDKLKGEVRSDIAQKLSHKCLEG
jgi:hypothetical protein